MDALWFRKVGGGSKWGEEKVSSLRKDEGGEWERERDEGWDIWLRSKDLSKWTLKYFDGPMDHLL